MLDLIWLICAFEFANYIVSFVLAMYMETPGNDKVDKAWWTRNGQFSRMATAGEIQALEATLNSKTAYAGEHPVAAYYAGGAPYTSIIVVILYFMLFWNKIYVSPLPGLFLVIAFFTLHTVIHMQVFDAYAQTSNKGLRRFAIFVYVYKLLIALTAIPGVILHDSIGVELGKGGSLFLDCMVGVLASWIVVYGIFCLWYHGATHSFRIRSAILPLLVVVAAYMVHAEYNSTPDNMGDMLVYLIARFDTEPEKALDAYKKFLPESEDAVIRTYFGIEAKAQPFYRREHSSFYHVVISRFMEELSRDKNFLRRIMALSDAYPTSRKTGELSWVADHDMDLFRSWYQSVSPKDERYDSMSKIIKHANKK